MYDMNMDLPEIDPWAEMPLTASDLLVALAEHERRAAVLALAVRRVEATGAWAVDGSESITGWLRCHGRMAHRTALGWVRRGRFLDTQAVIAEAAADGTLSEGQVDALQRVCVRRVEPIMRGQQRGLVDAVKALSVADTEKACAVWKQRAEAIADGGAPPAEAERTFTMGRGAGGEMVGRFVLGAAAGTELEQAIRTAITWEGSDDSRTHQERAADALHDIAAFWNRNNELPGTPRHRPHIELSVTASSLNRERGVEAFDADGNLVEAHTADTLLCDCVLHRVMRDPFNHPVAYGRSHYTAPLPLFRLVAVRDGGCRFPGCNRPVRQCDAHHVRYWRHGGQTDADNLLLLCNRHHHMVHRLGLDLKLRPDGVLRVTWPDGSHRSSVPRGAPPDALAGAHPHAPPLRSAR